MTTDSALPQRVLFPSVMADLSYSLLPAAPEPAKLAVVADTTISSAFLTAKRITDVVLSALLLLVLLPFMLLIALAILLTSRGPVLLVQDRVGLRGQPLGMLKFRTMIDGAHELRDEVIGRPDDGILDRYRDDPRITPVGRVLRRWSLDELPQLLNVLGGSMSLVGPRPILPEELPLLSPAEQRRHSVKPGMTGLWQVRGRKTVTWDDRMALDQMYLDECSMRMDSAILMRTLGAVVHGVGAY
ncbi:MAG: sugar transferase [Actinomycetes bacterium]